MFSKALCPLSNFLSRYSSAAKVHNYWVGPFSCEGYDSYYESHLFHAGVLLQTQTVFLLEPFLRCICVCAPFVLSSCTMRGPFPNLCMHYILKLAELLSICAGVNGSTYWSHILNQMAWNVLLLKRFPAMNTYSYETSFESRKTPSISSAVCRYCSRRTVACRYNKNLICLSSSHWFIGCL